MDVVCEGLADGAGALVKQVLEQVVANLAARDAALPPANLARILVVDDFAAQADGGSGPMLARHAADGVTLVVEGAHVARALAGDAGQVGALVHALHRELCRIDEARARLADAAPTVGLSAHLAGIAEGMWLEYASTRRAAWSLPADADLMLKHLADLMDVLPGAMAEDIAVEGAGGNLEALFAKGMARVGHLLQTVAHAQGYLDGLERSLEQVFPELAAQVRAGFLAAAWPRVARALASLRTNGGNPAMALEGEILAVFAALGLTLSRDAEGAAWLDLGKKIPDRRH